MNKKIVVSVFAVLIAMVALSSCDLITTLKSIALDQADEQVVEPAQNSSNEALNEASQSGSSSQPAQDSAPTSINALDVDVDFWLTYDTQIWDPESNGDYWYLVSRANPSCQLHYQFGHGMDFEIFDNETETRKIGKTLFDITRWFRVDNPSETMLYGYKSGTLYFSIEDMYDVSPISDECITHADDVLRLSLEKKFKAE